MKVAQELNARNESIPSIDTTNEIKSIRDIKNDSGRNIYTKNEMVQALIRQLKVYQCLIQ